jgi:hypothetical protein
MRMSGAEITVTNTATHTADTPQLLLEHHLKELRLPTILREYDKVARQCAVEQLDYQRYLLRMTELELLEPVLHIHHSFSAAALAVAENNPTIGSVLKFAEVKHVWCRP